jgi:hypothetical protein
MEKIYQLLLILILITIFIFFSLLDLILFTTVTKYIDIKILITDIKNFVISINTIFIDNKILEKIFEILVELGDKIIPRIYNFFNVSL